MTDLSQLIKRKGRCLPHWICEGSTYAVNFRLFDSLPHVVIEQLQFERDDIYNRAKQAHRELNVDEKNRLDYLYSDKIENYLNVGYGCCLLRKREVAQIVKDAFLHFHGIRYNLIAWCIMPNHAHVIVKPISPFDLSQVNHTWKSYTAHEVNKLLCRTGSFWEIESYDHLIRDDADFQHCLHYLLSNPEKANLKDWPWCDYLE